METNFTSLLIAGFVFLMLGVVLIAPISTSIIDGTSKTDVANEAIDISSSKSGPDQVNESISNFTLTNYPTDWKILNCPISSFTYGNATIDYVLDTDYNFFSDSGIIKVLNTTTTEEGGNSTLADYTYCSDSYLDSSWGRLVLNTVPGFYALALLGIGLWFFYEIAKRAGII